MRHAATSKTSFPVYSVASGYTYVITIGGHVTSISVAAAHIALGTVVFSNGFYVGNGLLGIVTRLHAARQDHNAIRAAIAALPTSRLKSVNMASWLEHLFSHQGTCDIFEVSFEGWDGPVTMKAKDFTVIPTGTTVTLDSVNALR